jgi:hypothetical protein
MVMRKFLFGLALLVGASASTLAMAEDSIVAQITDGKPWNAKASDASNMKMTLNPDGTGKVKFGPMSRKIGWTPNSNGLCLTGIPGGKKCVEFTAIVNGFSGKAADGKTLTLTR